MPHTIFKTGLLLASTLIAVGCSKHTESDPRTQPLLVRVTSVANSSGTNQLYTGVVTARVESDLGFRVAGKVTARLVDVGQTVHAGQPLMRIDVTDYTHAITNQHQNVQAAKARAEQAAADEARYRPLVASGAVSASTYDQVKATADAANAQLAAAQAQERIANDQGDYSILLADSAGTVVDTSAEPGQVVAAGQTVIKLAHAGPREAAVYLPETFRPAIGSSVSATLYGSPETEPARLRQLADSSDPATRTFEARYVLQGKQANAPLGATVTVQIPLAHGTVSENLPNAAITDRGNGPGVWIIDRSASTVSFRPVKILQIGEESTVIAGGIQPGELVVALGAHLLSDGQHVRVAEKEMASR
jgi:RND family efflux transporter MFP subunit